MTLKDAVEQYRNDLTWMETAIDREWGYSADYLKGFYNAIDRALHSNLWRHVTDLNEYRIRPATHREKKLFTRHVKWTASSWDVAINNIYGIKIEEGKEYTSNIKPWGIFEFFGKKYPVYADDPGQCDYIIIDGETHSAGSYNYCPEEEFIVMILEAEGYKVLKKLKGE